MKTFEDILKQHGWKPGLWNDSFSKRFISEEFKADRRRRKLERLEAKRLKRSK